MKKIIIVLLAILTLAFYTAISIACAAPRVENAEKQKTEFEDMFGVLYEGVGDIVFYDRRTGVQYISRMHGGITVMVDSDGKPLIYDGESVPTN